MTNSRTYVMSLVTAISILSNAVPIRAEVAPIYRAQRQLAAPEALRIKIKSCRVSRKRYPESTVCGVCAIAEVTEVTRSESGLRVGQQIVIEYTTREMHVAIPGPAEVPVLENGEKTSAFLHFNKLTRSYEPAAAGNSFSSQIIVNEPKAG